MDHADPAEPAPGLDLVLHLDRDTTALRGCVEDASGIRRSFHGWLELSSLLDGLRGLAVLQPASEL